MKKLILASNSLRIIIVLLVFNVNVNVWGQNLSSSTLTFHQREVLDKSSGLSLEWNVSLESKRILLTIETQREVVGSYVALGLTNRGRIENGTDVIVTGIEANNGMPFVVDMIAISNRTVVQDRNQDWQLIDSQRLDSGGSRITIQRRLEACDDQDTAFNTNLIKIVWDQGQTQTAPPTQLDINISNESRPIYFLDPIVVPQPPENGEILDTFRISRRFLVPPRHTSYWCSLHKFNKTLNAKHHIIGFAPYFENDLGRTTVHHQVLYRCIAPPGSDPEKLFEPFVDWVGEECYINNNTLLPRPYCAEYVHEWAIGGKNVPFTETVGFPLGGDSSPVEYFLYETHYNNPQVRTDLVLETGVDFLYSNRLRPNEGSIMMVGYGPPGQWAMPPKTAEFDVAGHCNPNCTATMFPAEGVYVLGTRLHAHLNSRRIKIKHFRGNTELPWIQNDDNYDFNFQSWRWLYEPVKLLPGDQITVQCGYDNTWKNDSTATLSGYSTMEEMCIGWFILSKRLPHSFCLSEYPAENTMARFGIQNMTWDVDTHDRIIRAATNPQNVGLTFTQLATNIMSNWSPEQKLTLENEQLYGQHFATCPNHITAGRIMNYIRLIQEELPEGVELPLPQAFRDAKISDETLSTPGRSSVVRYPREVPEYVPPNSCPTTEETRGRWRNTEEMSPRGRRTNERYPFKRKSSIWGGPDPIELPYPNSRHWGKVK